jgi:hypothetical protein
MGLAAGGKDESPEIASSGAPASRIERQLEKRSVATPRIGSNT